MESPSTQAVSMVAPSPGPATSSRPPECAACTGAHRAIATAAPSMQTAVQAEDQPHGGGLAGAVRAEEPGDHAGPDREGEVVDRCGRTVALAEPPCLDHRASFLLSVVATGTTVRRRPVRRQRPATQFLWGLSLVPASR